MLFIYHYIYVCRRRKKIALFICGKCASDELRCNFSSDNSTVEKINIAVQKPRAIPTMVPRSHSLTRKMRFLQYLGLTDTDIVAFMDRVCETSCLFMVIASVNYNNVFLSLLFYKVHV